MIKCKIKWNEKCTQSSFFIDYFSSILVCKYFNIRDWRKNNSNEFELSTRRVHGLYFHKYRFLCSFDRCTYHVSESEGLFIWAKHLRLTSEINFKHCLYGIFLPSLKGEVNPLTSEIVTASLTLH